MYLLCRDEGDVLAGSRKRCARRDRLEHRSGLSLPRTQLPRCVFGGHHTCTTDRETRGHRCGRLEREAGADGGAAAAEEGAQRAGDRYERERLQRAALCTLTARERRTLRALAQVRAQLCALGPRQATVEL